MILGLVCLSRVIAMLVLSQPLPQLDVSESAGATHIVVETSGDVEFKRERWTAYAPARFGASLHRGDLIRLGVRATARIVCADLSLNVVSNVNVTGVPCGETSPLLVSHGSLIVPARGEAAPGYPTVIAPRRSKLLDVRPSIRWTRPAGVTAATVTLIGPAMTWTRSVTGRIVPYPSDVPPLVRGTTYRVVVRASGRGSDEEGQAGAGFMPVTMEEVESVGVARRAIERLSLGPDATALLTARLYGARGFVSEAIAQVSTLAEHSKQSAFSRELAGLFVSAGLNRLGADAYRTALDRACEQNDIEAQAALHYSLGVLYADVFGNVPQASDEFRAAHALYKRLGDEPALISIRERLREK
jgi:hypothetical protein